MYKIIGEKAVSVPYVIGTSDSGVARERFKTHLPGAYLDDADISPRVLDKYKAGDLHTLSFLSKVKSDDEVEEPTEDETPDAIDPEGFQNPDLAHPAGAEVPSSPEESSTVKEDYNDYTVDVLKERIGGRGLTIPTDARKPDLVKILEQDDAGKGSDEENPFETAQ
jgi:hypothetical protein